MKLNFKVFSVVLLAGLMTVGIASAQLTLVPNGDFENGGTDWRFAGVGAVESYQAMGGNGGGHGQIDQTAGGWGGVLVAEDTATGGGLSLSSLGVAAGSIATFSIDMKDFTSVPGPATVAGMKIENWDANGIINDSGDVVFTTTGDWDTYTFDFLVDANSTGLKFVPLLVAQPTGSSVGYDNVGVVSNVIPEPTTAGLVALSAVAVALRRRRV